MMTPPEIARLRLAHQKLISSSAKSPKEALEWMGAVQAQDPEMSKWAIGIRCRKPSLDDVSSALENGEIIRTHLLRPTWHLVCARDVYWLLDLTAPRIRITMKSRHKKLGLSKEIVTKSGRSLENAFRTEENLTRDELIGVLKLNGVPCDGQRASHLLLCAELDQLICSGRSKNGRPAYAFLPARVPETNRLNMEESLARLALLYFRSRGPATLKDFAWWSGLTLTEVKQAVSSIELKSFQTGETDPFYYSEDSHAKSTGQTLALPPYDEFLLSYRDRSAVITKSEHKKAISENGIFRPLIIRDGKGIGIWKRIIKKGKISFETSLFSKEKKVSPDIQTAFDAYRRFVGLD